MATKTTKAAQTTKKTTKAKSVAPAKSRKTTKVSVWLERLPILHKWLALFYGAAALAVGVFAKAWLVTLHVPSLVRDGLLSSDVTSVYGVGIHAVVTIDLRWLLVGLLLFAAVASAVLALRPGQQVSKDIAAGHNPVGWILVSSGLGYLAAIMALLLGARDVVLLTLVGLVSVAGGVMGYALLRRGKGMSHVETVFGQIIVAVPWLVVATYALTSFVLGSAPLWAYVTSLSVCVLVAVLTVIIWLQRCGKTMLRDYTLAQYVMTLGLFAVVMIACAQVFAGALW